MRTIIKIIQTAIRFLFIYFFANIEKRLFCVFTHVASMYANLLEQKKAFT